jgi:branched-chain amino acid transport system permease protein
MHRVMAHALRVKTSRLDAEYAEAGKGAKTVLFLHGNLASWRWWEQTLNALPVGVRGIAVTMRGCRGTPGRGGHYSMAELAADVEAFAVALKLERFHLVGHSIGGAVALEYALRYPARLSGLDLVSPAPGDSLASMSDARTYSGWVLRQIDPHKAIDRFALVTMLRLGRDLGTNKPYLRRRLKAFMPGADLEAIGFERLVQDAAAMEPLAMVGLYRGLADWDVRGRCSGLKVPTRLLAGARDVLVSPKALEGLAAEIPGAALQVIHDGGHCPMLEQPARFAAWLALGVAGTPGVAVG